MPHGLYRSLYQAGSVGRQAGLVPKTWPGADDVVDYDESRLQKVPLVLWSR